MTNTTDTWKQNADRAMELFERKSPEQLAVELVQMQDKHAQAMDALDRMQDQRDQLAAQHKDTTRQCELMAGLLRETLNMVPAIGVQISDLPVVDDLLERIDAAIDGHAPTQPQQSLLDWAVTSWHDQVANRPMENVYRRTLDSVWRQVSGSQAKTQNQLSALLTTTSSIPSHQIRKVISNDNLGPVYSLLRA